MITKKEISKLAFFMDSPGTAISLIKLFKYLYIFDMYCQINFGIKSKEQYFASEVAPVPLNIWTNMVNGKFQNKFSKDFSIYSLSNIKAITIPNIRRMEIIWLPVSEFSFDESLFTPDEINAMKSIKFMYKYSSTSAIVEKEFLGKNYWKRFVESGAVGEDMIINVTIPVGKVKE